MIATERIESVGTREVFRFWDGVDKRGNDVGGAGWVKIPEYPEPCPEALGVKKLRRELGVYTGDAARACGLGVIEFCELERGKRRPVEPSSWRDVLDAVQRAPRRGAL